MARPVLFTCPATGLRVQHRLDDPDDAPDDEHEGVECPACAKFHFINRRTGKVLGQDEL